MSIKAFGRTAALISVLSLGAWQAASAQGLSYFSIKPTAKERQQLNSRSNVSMDKATARSSVQTASASLVSDRWGDWKSEAFWSGPPPSRTSTIQLEVPEKWRSPDRIGDTRRRAQMVSFVFSIGMDSYFCVRFDMNRVVTNQPLPRSDGDYLPGLLLNDMKLGGPKPLISEKASIDVFFNGKLGATGGTLLDVPYEFEVVQFNDFPVTGHLRTAHVGKSVTEHLEVPISQLRFPTLPIQEDGTPRPAWNMVVFRVDMLTLGWRRGPATGPHYFQYACEDGGAFVTDAELQYKAIAPIFLVHGTDADRTTWKEPSGTSFIDFLQQGWGTDGALAYPGPWSNAVDIQKDLHGNGSIDESGKELVNGIIKDSGEVVYSPILPRLLQRYGAKYCHIVAHSKGGSDSRQCIRLMTQQGKSEDLYKDGKFRILSLYTIGTPHKGTILSDVCYQTVLARENNGLFLGPGRASSDDPILNLMLASDRLLRLMGGAVNWETVNPARTGALKDQQTGEMAMRWRQEKRIVANYLTDKQGKVHFYSVAGDADANGDYTVNWSEYSSLIPVPLVAQAMYQTLGEYNSLNITTFINMLGGISINIIPDGLPLGGAFAPNDLVGVAPGAIGPGAEQLVISPLAPAKPPFKNVYAGFNHTSLKHWVVAQSILNFISNDFPEFEYGY